MLQFNKFCDYYMIQSDGKWHFNIGVTVAELLLTIILFIMSFYSVRRIKRRDYQFLAEFDTYCILSVLIIRCAQLAMALFFAYKTITMIQLFSYTMPKCLFFMRLEFIMTLPFGAANGLVIMALWAENIVQKCLVNFESQYTSGEVYFIYQNTQVFIQKERRVQYTIIAMFLGYLLATSGCIALTFLDKVQLAGYIALGISGI